MLTPPAEVSEVEIADALASHWSIDPRQLSHEPLGFGAHHWKALDQRGGLWFVTVDDLRSKPWLGDEPPDVLRGLGQAYEVASALQQECGLEFVLSAAQSQDGRTVQRFKDRWAISVTPFLDGRSGSFGDSLDRTTARALAHSLARLHAARPTTVQLRRDDPHIERQAVIDLLATLGDDWVGGPWSGVAREWCLDHSDQIRRLLDAHEALEAQCTSPADAITHGEPHPGNVMVIAEPDETPHPHLMLVDWDTIAIARRERDVWLAAGGAKGALDDDFLVEYERASGQVIDRAALEVARLRWTLADVASLASDLKAPHVRNEDTDATWRFLTGLDLSSPGRLPRDHA